MSQLMIRGSLLITVLHVQPGSTRTDIIRQRQMRQINSVFFTQKRETSHWRSASALSPGALAMDLTHTQTRFNLFGMLCGRIKT